MTGAALRRYCLSKPGAVAEYPFGPGARVYKAAGKMFALAPDESPLSISLKCDPALAEILREQFLLSVRATTSTNVTGTPSPSTDRSPMDCCGSGSITPTISWSRPCLERSERPCRTA